MSGGRKFTPVSPTLWRSGRFLALSSAETKLFYVYLLTCDHQNSSGCFRLPDGYATADLGWTPDQVRACRDELVEADMIAFDPNTSTLYVRRWFRHCAPQNEKHATGIRKMIYAIDCDEIRELVEEDFVAAEAHRKGPGTDDHPFPEASGHRLTGTGYMRGGGR